jgi:hypothetical protein
VSTDMAGSGIRGAGMDVGADIHFTHIHIQHVLLII